MMDGSLSRWLSGESGGLDDAKFLWLSTAPLIVLGSPERHPPLECCACTLGLAMQAAGRTQNGAACKVCLPVIHLLWVLSPNDKMGLLVRVRVVCSSRPRAWSRRGSAARRRRRTDVDVDADAINWPPTHPSESRNRSSARRVWGSRSWARCTPCRRGRAPAPPP